MGCLVFPRRLTAALEATAPPVVGRLRDVGMLDGWPGRTDPVADDPGPVRGAPAPALTFEVTLAEPGS